MKKVLIIDDNESQHYFYKIFMGRYFSCDIITAYNGEEGLIYVEKESPDLVILDIAMPVMDGVKFLEQLRINEKKSSIPVIAITGYDDRTILIKLLSLGISDYLLKPFNVFSIYQKLEKHLPANSLMLT